MKGDGMAMGTESRGKVRLGRKIAEGLKAIQRPNGRKKGGEKTLPMGNLKGERSMVASQC